MALLARRVRLRCRPALLSSPARAMSADRGAPRFKVVRPPPPEVLYGRPEDMHAETPEGAKTLHVTMLGPPNAGKSVLTNRFVQSTVTAASSKYHTTRRRMVGVMTREKSQVCLYDTPGVVEPRSPRYRERLIASAVSAVKVADACLVVVDAAARLTDERRDLLGSLIDTVAANGAEPWLVLNKMDLVHKRWRRAKRKEYEEAARSAYAGLEHVHPISAQHMVGVDALRDALFDAAKPGDWEYAGHVKTDLSDMALMEEVVRGKVFNFTYREVPYKVRQANKGWVERPNGSVRVYQQLQVSSPQHYRILKGEVVNLIEKAAEKELCSLLQRDVDLVLTVSLKRSESFRSMAEAE